METGSFLAQSAIRTCETHEHEDVDMYCYTCKKSMCSKCIKKQHRTHEWETLSKIARQKRADASGKCQTIRKTKIPEINEFLNSLKEVKATISQETFDAINRVKNFHNDIVAASEAVMNKMIASLENNLKRLDKNLDDIENLFQKQVKDIMGLVEIIEQNKNSYTNHSIVEMDEELDSRILKAKTPDVKVLSKCPTFLQREFNIKVIESLYGDIKSEDEKTSQLKTFLTFVKDTPQVTVTETSGFAHGETEILTICPISNTEAWLHQGESEGNQLMTLNGKKKQELKIGMAFPQFTLANNGDTIHTSYDTCSIYRTIADGQTSTMVNMAPLQPVSMTLSQCGGLLITLVDEVKYSNDQNSQRLVRLVTMTGEVKKTYQFNKDGKEQLFTYPNSVRQNHNSDICVVNRTSYSSGHVVIMQVDGLVKEKYKGQKAKYKFDPTDIACDPNCNLIIGDCVNHTIHLVTQGGQFLKFLVMDKKGSGPQYPRSLALYNDNLWVGSADGKVRVFKYKC